LRHHVKAFRSPCPARITFASGYAEAVAGTPPVADALKDERELVAFEGPNCHRKMHVLNRNAEGEADKACSWPFGHRNTGGLGLPGIKGTEREHR
jgi:hypothetical protein